MLSCRGLICLCGFETWDSNAWFCSFPSGCELILWALLFKIPLWKIILQQNKYAVYTHRCVFKSPMTSCQCDTLRASYLWSIYIAWCKAPVTLASNMFWLSRVGDSSGHCCYVAGKNSLPVVMWARGLLGWRAKALRWNQFLEEDYV